MEVTSTTTFPLSQSCPVVHPGLLGLSPFPYAYTGQDVFSPLTMNNMFLTGFSDCAEEALRFLTDVEGLSPSHPMVIGLHHYLQERQRLLELELLLRDSFLQNSTHSTPIQPTQTNSEQNSFVSDFSQANSRHEDNINDLTSGNTVDSEHLNVKTIGVNNDCNIDVPGKVEALVNELFTLLQEEDESFLESDSDTDEGFDEIIEHEVIL